MQPIIPTSDNIVSITYQLRSSITTTGQRAQLPILSIQFQDGGFPVRTKIVGFQEMLTYLHMLKAKADSLGKFVVCDPPSTYDNSIILYIGVPAPPASSGNVTFKLDSVDFDGTNELTNLVNTSGVGLATRAFADSPFFVSFKLPIINPRAGTNRPANFNSEYTIAGGDNISVQEVSADYDDTYYWTVVCSVHKAVSGNFNVTVTTKAFDEVTLMFEGSPMDLSAYGVSGEYGCTILDAANGIIGVLKSPFSLVISALPDIGGNNGYDDYFVNQPDNNGISFSQVSDLDFNYWAMRLQCQNPTGFPLTLNIYRRNRFNTPYITNNVVPNPRLNITWDMDHLDSGQTADDKLFFQIYNSDNGAQASLMCYAPTEVKRSALSLTNFDLSTYLNGGTIGIGANVFIICGFLSNNGAGKPANDVKTTKSVVRDDAGAGVAVDVRLGNSEELICGTPSTTVYTDDGTVSPGKTLYNDAALTVPVTIWAFVSEPLAGIIYHLAFTGLVGAATGNAC